MGIESAMKELTESIALSRKDRAQTVRHLRGQAGQLANETRKMMGDFQSTRNRAIGQMREELSHDAAERRTAVESLRGESRQAVIASRAHRKEVTGQLKEDLLSSQAKRRSAVAALTTGTRQTLMESASARREEGRALRSELAADRAGTQSAVKEIAASVKEMQAGFRGSRKTIRDEIIAARTAWQEVSRGQKSADEAAVETVADTTAEAAEITEKAEITQTEARSDAQEQEADDLEAKLLSAVNEHPLGITLSEVAGNMNIATVVLGRAAKKLIDEGKVRREDRTYFPEANG